MNEPTKVLLPHEDDMEGLKLKMRLVAQANATRAIVSLLRQQPEQTGPQALLQHWAATLRSVAPTLSLTVAPRLPELHPEAKKALVAAWQEQTEAMLQEFGL